MSIDSGTINWKAVYDEARERARGFETSHADAYQDHMVKRTEETKLAWWKAHDRLVQALKECSRALDEWRRAGT